MELLELKEETVAQETVYEGIIVNVRRDQARLADGRVTNREVIEHPGGVAVFAVDEQERVIMVRQFRYPMGEVVSGLPSSHTVSLVPVHGMQLLFSGHPRGENPPVFCQGPGPGPLPP